VALTLKQSAFVNAALKGATHSDAYRTAYDCSRMTSLSVTSSASRLAAQPNIAAVLAKERERVALAVVKATAYTMQDAMDEANQARELAHSVGQAGAAVSAVTLRAKLAGHLIERKEVRIGQLDDSDLDDLLAMRDYVREERVIEAEVVEVDESTMNRPQIRG